MPDIQINDDTKISNNTLSINYPATTLSVGAAVGAGFCFLIAYFTLMPLIEGTHLDMPRTFFIGIGGSGLAWGLALIYAVLDHRARTEVNMNSKCILLERRKFGSLRKTETALAMDAVITKDDSTSVAWNSDGPDRSYRTVYVIELRNGSSVVPLYSGLQETEAQEILDFFEEHGLTHVKTSTGLNKGVAIGTALFMAALLAELYSKGSLS